MKTRQEAIIIFVRQINLGKGAGWWFGVANEHARALQHLHSANEPRTCLLLCSQALGVVMSKVQGVKVLQWSALFPHHSNNFQEHSLMNGTITTWQLCLLDCTEFGCSPWNHNMYRKTWTGTYVLKVGTLWPNLAGGVRNSRWAVNLGFILALLHSADFLGCRAIPFHLYFLFFCSGLQDFF